MKWDGSLPKDSISGYNAETKQTEYVCKDRCHAGAYIPPPGGLPPHRCSYPYGSKEMASTDFEILVNQDHFEKLDWKKGSEVTELEMPVKTCEGTETYYVGRNEHGLGKVNPKTKTFYFVKNKVETQSSDYEVLTISGDVQSQTLFDVKYKVDPSYIKNPKSKVMKTSIISNQQCRTVSKEATLSKTTREERRWEVGSSLQLSVKTTIKAGMPTILSSGVEIGSEASFSSSGGGTVSKEVTHSETIKFEVPPNHSCKAMLMGTEHEADIPFSARLRRLYADGRTAETRVEGKYHHVQVGEIHVELERCQPVDTQHSCPEEM
ncbi:natterin-3-like isoform 2-T3 [Menidia menidia]